MDSNQAWGGTPFNPRPVIQGAPAPWSRQAPQVQEGIPSIGTPPLRPNPMGGSFQNMKPTPPQAARPIALQNVAVVSPPAVPRLLSREEKLESARINMEERLRQHGFAGFQVVRREFISHSYEPMMTVRENSVMFNNSCISRLENANYIQFLINPEEQKLIIRPCNEGDRDAIRWCVTKKDKRHSRQITCREFTQRLYELMGWGKDYRYKLQGIGISYRDEKMYLFDLQTKEAYAPGHRDPQTGKRARSKAILPEDWKDFGLSVEEHELSTKVDLSVGYVDPATIGNEEAAEELNETAINAENQMTEEAEEVNGHE